MMIFRISFSYLRSDAICDKLRLSYKNQIFPKPVFCSRFGDLANGNINTTIFIGGSIAENESHRFHHFTSTKLWRGLPYHKQSFIDIMMEDTPEVFLIFPAQFHTGGFHNRVANGIGMSDAFSLHQFNWLLIHGQIVYFFYINISLNVQATFSLFLNSPAL